MPDVADQEEEGVVGDEVVTGGQVRTVPCDHCVAAAASVPSSFTSTKAFCDDARRSVRCGSVSIPVKSAPSECLDHAQALQLVRAVRERVSSRNRGGYMVSACRLTGVRAIRRQCLALRLSPRGPASRRGVPGRTHHRQLAAACRAPRRPIVSPRRALLADVVPLPAAPIHQRHLDFGHHRRGGSTRRGCDFGSNCVAHFPLK